MERLTCIGCIPFSSQLFVGSSEQCGSSHQGCFLGGLEALCWQHQPRAVSDLIPNVAFMVMVVVWRRSRPPAAMASSADPDASTPPAAPQLEPARKAVRVVVKGRVTGVGFRDWTASTAESLGLAGWVRNRRDGSVEALLSGDPAKIEDMITRRLPVGPPPATVTAVVPSPAEPVDPSAGFEIKFTV